MRAGGAHRGEAARRRSAGVTPAGYRQSRALSWVAIGGLVLAGCRDLVRIDVDLEIAPGEAAVVVVADEAGVPRSSSLLRADQRVLSVPMRDDERLLAFLLGPDELITPTGAPLPTALFEGLAVRSSSEEPRQGRGACGRCLLAATSSPAIVFTGDSCTIPPFVRSKAWRLAGASVARVEGAEASALFAQARPRVRLDWPGDCPCDVPAEGAIEPGPREACVLAPEGLYAEIEELAQTPDGAVGLAGHRLLAVIDPLGRRAIVRGSAAPRDPIAISPVLTSSGTWSFLVAGRDSATAHRMVRLDATPRGGALAISAEPISGEISPTFVPSRMTRGLEPGRDDALYVLGASRQAASDEIPAAARCTIRDRGVACTPLPIAAGSCRTLAGELTGAARLAGGGRIAIGDEDLVFLSPPGALSFVCDGRVSASYTVPEAGEVRATSFEQLGVLGDRAFVCSAGQRSDGTGGALVLTGHVPEPRIEGGVVASAPVSLAGAHWLPGVKCGTFSVAPGGSHVRLMFSSGAEVELDAQGAVIAARAGVGLPSRGTPFELFGEVAHPIEVLGSPAPGWTVAVTSDGAVFRGRDGEPLEHVFGPRSYDPTARTALLARGAGRFVAFTAAQMIEIDATGGGCTIGVVTSSIAGIAGDERDIADLALLDHERGAVLVAGRRLGRRRGGGSAWFRWIDLETRALIEERSFERDIGAFAAGAELGPGHLLLIAGGVVYEVRGAGGDLAPLEPVESDLLAFTKPPSGAPPRRYWRSIAVSHGVAWVSGDGAIARIKSGGAGRAARMEAVSLSRVEGGGYATVTRTEAPILDGVLTSCADRAAFAAIETYMVFETKSRRHRRVWDLQPAGASCRVPDMAEPAIASTQDVLRLCSAGETDENDELAEMFGLVDDPWMMVTTGALLRLLEGRAGTSPIGGSAAAVSDGRVILVGGRNGRLLAFVPAAEGR